MQLQNKKSQFRKSGSSCGRGIYQLFLLETAVFFVVSRLYHGTVVLPLDLLLELKRLKFGYIHSLVLTLTEICFFTSPFKNSLILFYPTTFKIVQIVVRTSYYTTKQPSPDGYWNPVLTHFMEGAHNHTVSCIGISNHFNDVAVFGNCCFFAGRCRPDSAKASAVV